MSKKSLFSQPGIEQLFPGKELPAAVKVTGRNMHAVSLFVSVTGETAGVRTVLSSFFEADGSLSHVKLSAHSGEDTVKAGEYLILAEDKSTVVIAGAHEYEFIKTLLPLVEAIDGAIDSLLSSTLGK